MASPGRRLRHLARILAGERTVTTAARHALDTLLIEAAKALAGAGYSTDVLDNRLPGWRAAVDTDLVPAIETVFNDAFIAAGRGVVDPDVYALRHLEAVHNRLVGVSDDVFDAMRLTLGEGRQAGESIALLAARVNTLLADDQRWAGRAATIARTEVVSANNAGATSSAAATAAVLGEDPASVMKEWLATADSRTRETHLALDGTSVMGLDATFDNGLEYPGDPAGDAAEVVNCVVGSTQVAWPGQVVHAATRRSYAGTFVHLVTARGHDLTVTPNHPILTERGYVPAQSLRVGEHVLATLAPPAPEVQDGPPSIEQVHRAAEQVGTATRVRGSRVDFHGDGTDAEVQVVRPDRDLLLDGDEATYDQGTADAEVTRHLEHALALGMTPCEVIEVERYEGTHDVFNLQTSDAWYVGNGVAQHNCRCTVLFIYPGDPEYDGAVSGQAYGGRTTASEVMTPSIVTPQTVPADVPMSPAAVADLAVDTGPSTTQEFAARQATIQELQAQAAGSGKTRAAARAELRRRGLAAAAARTDDALTAEVVALMTRRLLTVDEVLAGDIDLDSLVLTNPDGTHAGTFREFINQEDPVTTAPPEAEAPTPTTPADAPTHAGLAVWAADTERVLMLQRSLDPTDAPDVAGTWEFPGGGIEEGETPQQGAEREFTEETGLPVPAGDITNGWRSDDGVYQGFVLTVPSEAGAFAELNPDLAAAESVNPDDPERRNPDVTAWFTLEQVRGLGPALRPEVHNTPWDVFTTPAEEAPMDNPTPEQVQAALATLSRVAAFAGGTYAPVDPAVAPDDAAPAMNPEDAPALAQDIAPDGEPFYGIACPEDVMSGDGRVFALGAITWRDLPLPLMYQDATRPGHDGAVRVGRLDLLERDESGAKPMIRYAGVWDTSPVAVEARRQVDAKVLRGVSVDCDAVEVQVTYTGSDGQPLDPAVDDFPEDGVVNETETATAARISGLTCCSIPAFHQAYIANGVREDRTDPEPGMAEVMDGTDPMPEDVVAVAAGAALLLTREQAGLAPTPAWALVASAGGIVMPAAAFTRPACLDDHETGTPLTVTADGRVYGHLATWGTCHIGITGLCQEPPASATNYAYFATGSVLTDAGDLQPVGHLTMETGHAGLRLGHHAAVSHYDNTGTAVADVAMGQDHIGIWYAGVVRPGVTEEQVYALRASGKASGDWRPVAGGLELVAALVVNTEGFPVPRPAIAASGGQVQALVAAGMVTTRRPVETPDDIHAIAAAAVSHALARRDRVSAVASRLAARREYARRARVAAATARLTERK